MSDANYIPCYNSEGEVSYKLVPEEDMLKQYRKEIFEEWIREQIDSWLHEYGAWDCRIEDPEDDFDEEDWEWIRENLRVSNINIVEVE